jgi:hypothetical protein
VASLQEVTPHRSSHEPTVPSNVYSRIALQRRKHPHLILIVRATAAATRPWCGLQPAGPLRF